MNSHKVMVALDNFKDKASLDSFLENLPQDLPIVKIGLEMFYRYGPDFVFQVKEKYNKEIFLDLKLHDIPNTVAKSMEALMDLPISFLTVHLSGGKEMLEACQTVRERHNSNINVLGVSYLTSLDKTNFNDLYGIEEEQIPTYFHRLFSLAAQTGTQGIVCSANELPLLNDYPKLLKVCPGIRFSDEVSKGLVGDQKRVLTPSEALNNGANYIVMGRSLTQASDLSQRVKELNT